MEIEAEPTAIGMSEVPRDTTRSRLVRTGKISWLFYMTYGMFSNPRLLYLIKWMKMAVLVDWPYFLALLWQMGVGHPYKPSGESY